MSNPYLMTVRVRSVKTTTKTPYWSRVLQVARARYHRDQPRAFTAASVHSLQKRNPVAMAARTFGVHAAVARRDGPLQEMRGKFAHYVQKDNPFAAYHVLRSIEARCKSLA